PNAPAINSRAGARAKVENNYFEDSKDVLGTFYTNQLGSWQVSGNIFDNVSWSSPGNEYRPAGPNPQSNTSVSIPYSYRLDGASCVPSIVAQTAGANKGLRVSDGSCQPPAPPTTPPPTTPPPTTPPVDGRYEAENAPATCDGAIESVHAGFSGTGFCNTNNASGVAAQYTISSNAAVTAKLDTGSANGTSSNRPANIVVNGVVRVTASFQPTGAWTNWSTATVNVPVNQGNNTIRLVATGSEGLANIDYLDVNVSGSGGPSPSPTPTP